MFSRLFRSRWAALFWAAGIVWTAYDVATDAPRSATATSNASAATDATGEQVSAADLAVLANAEVN